MILRFIKVGKIYIRRLIMKLKLWATASFIVLLFISLVACSNESNSDDSDATVIKYNSSRPSTDPAYKWYEEFFDEIEEKSNGTVKFEMYSDESLGGSDDMIEAATEGEPVISDGDFAYLGDYLSDLGVLSSPYLVREPEDWITVWESDKVQDLFSELEDEQGLKVMANFYVGDRNLISTE